MWKYFRPLNLAVSKLFFVSKLQFSLSKVTCVQLTCTFKLLSTVFIYLLSIWVVKIFWASKFSCLKIIFCLQITIFAFYLCNLLNNTHDCFLAYLLLFFLSFFLNHYYLLIASRVLLLDCLLVLVRVEFWHLTTRVYRYLIRTNFRGY